MSTNINISKKITVQDESVTLTPDVNSINITGAGATATTVGNDVTINIPGGSGGVTSVGLTAGTGISLSGTNPITSSGSITVTNAAPDQVVSLTAGTGIDITGTYPNFTIDNTGALTDTNIYNSDGTLTGVRTLTFTSNRMLFTGTNSSTTIALDLKASTGSGNRYGSLSATSGTLANSVDVNSAGVGISASDSSTLETCDVSVNSTQASLSYANGVIIRGITAGSLGLSVNNAFYLPTADGTANQVLTTNGAGVTSWSAQPEVIQVAASDETTDLTTGTAKVTFRMPYAMTLTGVRASLSTAQTAGALLTVDINLNGTSVLGTKLTFDNNEKTTVTAATPATIVTSALTDDGEITVDIDAVGTAGARGLKITLIGTRA